MEPNSNTDPTLRSHELWFSYLNLPRGLVQYFIEVKGRVGGEAEAST